MRQSLGRRRTAHYACSHARLHFQERLCATLAALAAPQGEPRAKPALGPLANRRLCRKALHTVATARGCFSAQPAVFPLPSLVFARGSRAAHPRAFGQHCCLSRRSQVSRLVAVASAARRAVRQPTELPSVRAACAVAAPPTLRLNVAALRTVPYSSLSPFVYAMWTLHLFQVAIPRRPVYNPAHVTVRNRSSRPTVDG